MKEKRILVIVNFFPPAGGGGVYRPLSFVKYLARFSWDVTVLTPKAGEFWISDPGLLNQIPDGVKVVRTLSVSPPRFLSAVRKKNGQAGPKRSTGSFELLRRLGELFLIPDTYVGWAPFAYRAASKLCRREDFDVILSTSPPDSTHLAAGKISRKYRIPWVVDFRDPWISLYLRDPITPVHRKLHQMMERHTVEAERILVTTDWQRRKLIELYPGCSVEKIPNGYEEEDFAGLEDVNPDPEKFTVLHAGMLTLERKSEKFLKGVSLFLNRTEDAKGLLRIIFAGGRESANEKWVSKLGLENIVVFKDNLPHRECVRLEKSSHVLLLIKHDDNRYNGLIPGKLYEYIGAARPILAVVPDGEAKNIVQDLDRGETAQVNDPEDIAGKIEILFDLYKTRKLDSSYSLEDVPKYSRRSEAERLNSLLSEVVYKDEQ